jgi:hypothetical protein
MRACGRTARRARELPLYSGFDVVGDDGLNDYYVGYILVYREIPVSWSTDGYWFPC